MQTNQLEFHHYSLLPSDTRHRRDDHLREETDPAASREWMHVFSAVGLIVMATLAVAIACAVTFLRIGFTPVLTDSMSPSLKAGSVAITRARPTLDLALGDVVILPLPDGGGQRYLHRIVELRQVGAKTLIKTQGDRNASPDPWQLEVTSPSAPVAVGSIPYVGWLTNVLHWSILRLVISAGIVLLVVIGMKRIRNQDSSHVEQERHQQPELSEA